MLYLYIVNGGTTFDSRTQRRLLEPFIQETAQNLDVLSPRDKKQTLTEFIEYPLNQDETELTNDQEKAIKMFSLNLAKYIASQSVSIRAIFQGSHPFFDLISASLSYFLGTFVLQETKETDDALLQSIPRLISDKSFSSLQEEDDSRNSRLIRFSSVSLSMYQTLFYKKKELKGIINSTNSEMFEKIEKLFFELGADRDGNNRTFFFKERIRNKMANLLKNEFNESVGDGNKNGVILITNGLVAEALANAMSSNQTPQYNPPLNVYQVEVKEIQDLIDPVGKKIGTFIIPAENINSLFSTLDVNSLVEKIIN